jgi:hypothetical protein
MILSASRRTDIPAYYSEWFMNRIDAGFVFVRNPMNEGQVSRIELDPGVVDCIVFWTRDPQPLMDRLDRLDALGYRYYFQITLTPYDRVIEPRLTDKAEILGSILELSRRIGPDRIVWRYDPILIAPGIDAAWHRERFERMAGALSGSTNECVISFLDDYAKAHRRMAERGIRPPNRDEAERIAEAFSGIASRNGMRLTTCAEAVDLERFGIGHAACVDRERIERILAAKLKERIRKDGQRPHCRCVECVDIGAYDTCPNGCVYCYATGDSKRLEANRRAHDPASSLLVGRPDGLAIRERKAESFRTKEKLTQPRLDGT